MSDRSRSPRSGRKPALLVVQTGGTIDKAYPRSKGGYAFEIDAPAAPVILQQVGFFAYEVRSITVCRLDSQEIGEEERKALARTVQEAPESLVLVTHGTDTLVESARYVARALEEVAKEKRVVFTGAMRPAKFVDSDAAFNVGGACAALSLVTPGVYICMNGRVLPAMQTRRDEEGLFVLE